MAVGLGFLTAFQAGDLDACMEMLHTDVEWYPSPRLLETEVLRGRNRARHYVESLHDRLATDLEVVPEDGRQVGDHVLMITVFQAKNSFTGQPVKTRECWVVSIRDDTWARVVCYPNGPVARLGFEEMLKAANQSQGEAPSSDTLAPAMAKAAPTPAEVAQADAPPAAAPAAGNQLTITLTMQEADALNRWLLKPSQDGALAADDSAVRPGLMKIRSAFEHAQAIEAVRKELEQAGVQTQHLSDPQVAQLGRRISQAAPRLGGQ